LNSFGIQLDRGRQTADRKWPIIVISGQFSDERDEIGERDYSITEFAHGEFSYVIKNPEKVANWKGPEGRNVCRAGIEMHYSPVRGDMFVP
jgi:hypothetical protein